MTLTEIKERIDVAGKDVNKAVQWFDGSRASMVDLTSKQEYLRGLKDMLLWLSGTLDPEQQIRLYEMDMFNVRKIYYNYQAPDYVSLRKDSEEEEEEEEE